MSRFLVGCVMACSLAGLASEAVRVTISIDPTRPAAWTVPSTLYGLFLEDISNGIDGAFYPEYVWNRGFDFPASDARGLPEGWRKDYRRDSTCRATLAYVKPKVPETPAYLRLESWGAGGGVMNAGTPLGSHEEMGVAEGVPLTLSLWARGDAPFDVALKGAKGVHVARVTFQPAADWRRGLADPRDADGNGRSGTGVSDAGHARGLWLARRSCQTDERPSSQNVPFPGRIQSGRAHV